MTTSTRKVKQMILFGSLIAYIGAILGANYVTTEYGMTPVGFGLEATAGTWLIGLLFILRDHIQDIAGKWAIPPLVLLGAGLSFLVSDPFIAVASVAAFAVAELVDFAIYTPLRKRGYIRAAVASNVVGAALDTLVFLWVAGFPIAGAFAGQMVGKVALTVVVVAAVAAIRINRKVATA